MQSVGGSKCFWGFRSLIQRKEVDSVHVGRREGHHQLARILSVTDLIAIGNNSINLLLSLAYWVLLCFLIFIFDTFYCSCFLNVK